MSNPYLPQSVKIVDIIQETSDIKRIALAVKTPLFKLRRGLSFIPGQFILAGVWGAGEAPFGLANSPYNRSRWEIMVRNTGGSVSSSLHQLKPKDTLTIRGPYGNGFPLRKLEGADIVAIAGGCGIPPIGSFLEYVAHNRSGFGKVYLLYGAAGAEHFAAKTRFSFWRKKKIEVVLTIDKPQKGWRGRTGFVSDHIKNLPFDQEKTYSLMCGPGPMFTASSQVLEKIGLPDQRILISQERKMSCGIGKCQHCTCGKYYVCLDGPVFSYDQIKNVYD
jgi:NAD(P)H-flavin reductase